MLIAEGEKEDRMFDNWSMAFHEFTSTDVKDINQALSIDNFISISKLTEKPTYAVELFWYMAKQLLEE